MRMAGKIQQVAEETGSQDTDLLVLSKSADPYLQTTPCVLNEY